MGGPACLDERQGWSASFSVTSLPVSISDYAALSRLHRPAHSCVPVGRRHPFTFPLVGIMPVLPGRAGRVRDPRGLWVPYCHLAGCGGQPRENHFNRRGKWDEVLSVVFHATSMARGISEIAEILSEDYEMSNGGEAGDLVRRVAEPRPVGDSVKQAIARAARRLRWSITRTKAIWYAEARRIDASEMDQLRAVARAQASRYASLAQTLRTIDPDMYEPDIIALLSAARDLGGEDQS